MTKQDIPSTIPPGVYDINLSNSLSIKPTTSTVNGTALQITVIPTPTMPGTPFYVKNFGGGILYLGKWGKEFP